MTSVLNCLLTFLVSMSMMTTTNVNIQKDIINSSEFNKDYTIYQEFFYDFNGDDFEDHIVLYTSAEKDKNGEFMWDDGQHWSLVVEIDDKKYDLYSTYLHGDMEFDMIELYKGEEVIPSVRLSVNGWAGIQIYHYDYKNGVFESQKMYDTSDYIDNGINVLN